MADLTFDSVHLLPNAIHRPGNAEESREDSHGREAASVQVSRSSLEIEVNSDETEHSTDSAREASPRSQIKSPTSEPTRETGEKKKLEI
jgi:hypothetical protein